jgi:hypothetical protein
MKNGDISNRPAHTLFVNLDLVLKQENRLFSKKFSVSIRDALSVNLYFRKDFRVVLVSFNKKNRKFKESIEKTLDEYYVLYNEVLYFDSFEGFRDLLKMYEEYTYFDTDQERVALVGANGSLWSY